MRLWVAALLLVAAEPVCAQDGRALFAARCGSCHSIDRAAPVGAGPKLAGLIGRRVAGDPGFDYSPVLEAARDAGDGWDGARLEAFLADPEAMYPGLWMGGNGLRRPDERAAVTAYLQSVR